MRQRGGQDFQLLRLQLRLHQHTRQAADAQPLRHTARNRFRTTQRCGGRQLVQMRQQRMLHHLARARARFAQQPLRLAQGHHTQRLAARLHRQRVGGRSHDDQFIAQPGLHLQPLPVAAAFNQAHIDFHGLHGLTHFLGVGDLQIHTHQRMRLRQPRQYLRQGVSANRGAGRHAQAHRQIHGLR